VEKLDSFGRVIKKDDEIQREREREMIANAEKFRADNSSKDEVEEGMIENEGEDGKSTR